MGESKYGWGSSVGIAFDSEAARLREVCMQDVITALRIAMFCTERGDKELLARQMAE